MSVWAWLKLTVCLWLLRKMIKLIGWLLLAAVAVAAWPVTLAAAAGYVCLLYTSPSPRDRQKSRMPSSA